MDVLAFAAQFLAVSQGFSQTRVDVLALATFPPNAPLAAHNTATNGSQQLVQMPMPRLRSTTAQPHGSGPGQGQLSVQPHRMQVAPAASLRIRTGASTWPHFAQGEVPSCSLLTVTRPQHSASPISLSGLLYSQRSIV